MAMRLPRPELLGGIYFASELLLNLTRRSRGDGVRQDRSTLRLLWVIIMSSVIAGVFVAMRWPAGALPHREFFGALGTIVFVLGLGLRWWAIIVLGRFFTVDVQIAHDHRLVETGPFRFVRHPSYTGVVLAFLGLGFALGNWGALVVMLSPIVAALIRRINVEEEALSAALGETYRAYARRTKRLFPGLY